MRKFVYLLSSQTTGPPVSSTQPLSLRQRMSRQRKREGFLRYHKQSSILPGGSPSLFVRALDEPDAGNVLQKIAAPSLRAANKISLKIRNCKVAFLGFFSFLSPMSYAYTTPNPATSRWYPTAGKVSWSGGQYSEKEETLSLEAGLGEQPRNFKTIPPGARSVSPLIRHCPKFRTQGLTIFQQADTSICKGKIGTPSRDSEPDVLCLF